MIGWYILLGLSVLLVLYPYVIYPMILQALPKRPLGPKVDRGRLSYALMFCAYNEERALPETIANLRRIKDVWPELEILAYSDCSSDRTPEILRAASDILTPVIGLERAGKPAGMRKLVASTEADVAIFMDANVLVAPETVRRFEDYFNRPEVGAVAGTLHYINEGDSTVANIGGLYWRLEEKLKRLESETGSTMGADGSLFAMRRTLYPFVRSDLQDDFLASMEVLFHGLRCVSAPDILAYEKAAVSSSSEFRRKRRIACGAFSSHRHMWSRLRRLPARTGFKYVSHKLIRWFGAFFLATGALAAFMIALHWDVAGWFILLLAVGLLLAFLAMRLNLSPIVKIVEIVAAMVATALGVLESVFGAKYSFWNPVDR